MTDGLAAPGVERLRQAGVTITDDRSALGRIEAWIVRSRTRVDAAAIGAAAPRLRVVGRAGVGVDNIDLEAARRASVVVVNAPEAATTAVAELTIGLMLALARHLPAADAALRRGAWTKAEMTGVELEGKTLGLVGIGRIGRAVARRAAAFGMTILAYDPYLSPETIRAAGAEPRAFETLLAEADFVSLHLPLDEQTRHAFGAQALAAMKPGARLVCAARGGVVDEAALLAALESGRLAGAALDVFEVEPPGEAPIVRHPRVVVTPHLGAETVEAQARVAADIADEVLHALRGEPLRWRVV